MLYSPWKFDQLLSIMVKSRGRTERAGARAAFVGTSRRRRTAPSRRLRSYPTTAAACTISAHRAYLCALYGANKRNQLKKIYIYKQLATVCYVTFFGICNTYVDIRHWRILNIFLGGLKGISFIYIKTSVDCL